MRLGDLGRQLGGGQIFLFAAVGKALEKEEDWATPGEGKNMTLKGTSGGYRRGPRAFRKGKQRGYYHPSRRVSSGRPILLGTHV